MSSTTQKTLLCPSCLSEKTSRSRLRGLVDCLLIPLPVRPYRCRHCFRRFWRLSDALGDWLLFALAVATLVGLLALLWTARRG